MGLIGFYFLPSGRIGRARFWLGVLGLSLIEGLFNLWLSSTLFGHDVLDLETGAIAKPARQLILLVNLIFMFPLFVVLARRFHDRNKGAIWALPFIVASVAIIAADILGLVQPEAVNPLLAAIGAVSLGLFLWIVIELGCLRGTAGINRFGPDPLAR